MFVSWAHFVAFNNLIYYIILLYFYYMLHLFSYCYIITKCAQLIWYINSLLLIIEKKNNIYKILTCLNARGYRGRGGSVNNIKNSGCSVVIVLASFARQARIEISLYFVSFKARFKIWMYDRRDQVSNSMYN